MKTYAFSNEEFQKSLKEVSKKKATPWGTGPLDKYVNDSIKIEVISKKCLSGAYKFSPYELKLKLKGRKKEPREISIPSYIDQAVLKSLDRSLKEACPITNQTELAAFTVSSLKKFLNKQRSEDLFVFRLDIKSYFQKIDQEILFDKIEKKNCPAWIINLTRSAVQTCSKEKYEKVSTKNTEGVPQGISIASYLADLYLEEFDKKMKAMAVQYYRYVDDILIIYEGDQNNEIKSYLEKKLEGVLKLNYHKDKLEDKKFFDGPLFSKKGFSFLGYHFTVSKDDVIVSVREESVQRFLNGVIGLIIKLQKGGYDLTHVDAIKANERFLFDVNEKITGAYKEDKRFGWLWYFQQMDDLKLLERMDRIIRRELNRDARTSILTVKRLKRTHYEIMHFGKGSKHILNYGMTDAEEIVETYGEIDKSISKAKGRPERVMNAYNAFVNRRVKKLQLDEVRASG